MAADYHTYTVSEQNVWVHNDCEIIIEGFKTFEQARNKVLSLVGDIGATKPYYRRLKTSKGAGKIIDHYSAVSFDTWVFNLTKRSIIELVSEKSFKFSFY